MQQFKLKESGAKEIINQSLKVTVPIILVSTISGGAFSIINSDNIEPINLYPYFFIIPVVGFILFFSIRKGTKRQLNIYRNYNLTITDEAIVRVQGDTPPINIPFDEVKKIVKSKKGWLTIIGASKSNVIIVPVQLEGIDELEQVLLEKCSLEINIPAKINSNYLSIFSVFLMLGGMFAVYTSDNKIIVSLSGVLITGVLIWSFINIITNKNIDRKTRRNSYYVIIVLLSVIGIVISKLL